MSNHSKYSYRFLITDDGGVGVQSVDDDAPFITLWKGEILELIEFFNDPDEISKAKELVRLLLSD